MTDGERHLTVARTGPPGEADPGGEIAPTDGMGVRERLPSILAAARDELGYETASLYVPSVTGGHHLLSERLGPLQTWHTALDGGLVDDLDDDSIHPNTRAMPGVGAQLAELGCGSIAVLTMAGARLIFDSPGPVAGPREIDPELAHELEETLGAVLHTPAPPEDIDLRIIERVADVTTRLLENPWPSTIDLVSSVRAYVGAERVFLLAYGPDAKAEVMSSDRRQPAQTAIDAVGDVLRDLPAVDPVPRQWIHRLAVLLDADHPCVEASYCEQIVSRRELLLVTWRRETTMSPDALRALARIIGSFRASVRTRRSLVDSQVAKERTRWIQDIHDGVTQAATAAVIHLENLRATMRSDPMKAADSIDSVQEDIRRSLADLREIMSGPNEQPVTQPTQRSLEALIDDVVQRWRLPARTSVVGDVDGLPEALVATGLFVIREALTNAAKHSAAKIVNVRVTSRRDGLRLVIKDNGRGFDPHAVPSRAGGSLGLRLMRLRIGEFGGTIDISSEPGAGTQVSAFLPTPGKDEPANVRSDRPDEWL